LLPLIVHGRSWRAWLRTREITGWALDVRCRNDEAIEPSTERLKIGTFRPAA
jgi:hypothetical protein